MRILYVVTAFPRWPGDVITPWLLETIQRLGDIGVSVEVLAPAYRGTRDQLFEGVRVHRFRYSPAPWETLTHDQTAPDRIRERPIYLSLVPTYVLSGSLAAARLARSKRFDVIHSFWPVPHSVLGLTAKYASGIPLVSTFFGVELTWLRTQLPLLRPVLTTIVKRSDAVTAISSYTASLLRELVPAATPTLVPFGAAISEYDTPRILSHRRESDAFEILFVGRLVERKGVHVLIDAMQQLRRERHGRMVRLEIVGDGPVREELAARVAAHRLEAVVRFHGAIATSEVRRRYAECDVFVLPAVVDAKGDTEGLGVVLIEALQYGKPVIASDVGGITDIVRHGETGLLVSPGDAGALAHAISQYMDEPDLARRLAHAGREYVQRTFSWDRITEQLVGLYSQLTLRGKT